MILILTQCFPPDRGGIETLMGGLADSLRENGDDVLVFADRVRGEQAGAQLAPPYPVRRFGGWRPFRRRIKAMAVGQTLKTLPITGVFADSWKSIEHLPRVSVPVIVLAHGMEFPHTPSARKRARIRRSLGYADQIIANSAFTAGLVADYVDDPSRITVINPPIPPQPASNVQSRAELGLIIGAHRPVLLTLSRLEPRKGVDAVIRAMPAVLRGHPDAIYVVAGSGSDETRLARLAEAEGVAERVLFMGGVDAAMKAALFSVATVFAMPARREGSSVEGFGISYIEAAWYGLPALAGREGGAPDAVIDGVTGLLCDADDPKDVEAKLMRLLDDETLRTELGDAAQLRARGPMQWKNAVIAFRGILTQHVRARAERG